VARKTVNPAVRLRGGASSLKRRLKLTEGNEEAASLHQDSFWIAIHLAGPESLFFVA
jgi:hypothetical protein